MTETVAERLLRETIEANNVREAMKTKPAIERLVEASERSIRINSEYPVGKDGRTRLSIAKISAEGDIADALRELGKLI